MEAASVGGLFHFNQACNVAYWHLADNPAVPAFVRFWTKADKRRFLACDGLSAYASSREVLAFKNSTND